MLISRKIPTVLALALMLAVSALVLVTHSPKAPTLAAVCGEFHDHGLGGTAHSARLATSLAKSDARYRPLASAISAYVALDPTVVHLERSFVPDSPTALDAALATTVQALNVVYATCPTWGPITGR